MVIENIVKNKLDEFHAFFVWAKDHAPNDTDKETAGYGLSKILWMKEVLGKYERQRKNIYLKQIHSGFSSVTRGVEGFDDEEISERFLKTRQGVYHVMTELEQEIKW